MTPLKVQDLRKRDDGIAMLFVMAIGLIVTGFIVASLASTLHTQRSARSERNITSAQAAAEAGLDDLVFQLGQFDSTGATNWALAGAGSKWTQASPSSKTFDTNAKYDSWVTTLAGSSDLIVWSRGTYAGNTRTLRAVVAQTSPPAFGYSMFASKGIDIHHHNSSYLSPQVWTTGVHSNGYINIDYSSEFTVNEMEAVGNLTFSKGGGSTPGASIPTTGYNWYDPLNGKCFPGGMNNPAGVPPSGGSCPGNYSGNAMIAGTIKAGSVTVGSRGQVLPVSTATTMDTGQVISAAPGDIQAGTATVGGTTYTEATAANCNSTNCNRGASAVAGQVSGVLKLKSGYAPPVIPFPSINYATTYRVKAQNEQAASGAQHVFSSGTEFLSVITAANSGNYRKWDSASSSWVTWNPGDSTAPGVIFLDGTYDITGGSLSLTYSNIKSLVNAATGTNGPAPVLLIRGSLIVEAGSLTLNAALEMVGAGNRTDFVVPGTATTPVTINTSTTGLLDPAATMPAVLAVGGSIKSSDYDTDSGWTASCACYEPDKSTPIYIRGLVYSGSWDSTASMSVPESQHWHNYDPKNLMKIYGAQVGGTLHDCNNFSFSYDPLVQKAFGFGGGTVYIKEYQELGT